MNRIISISVFRDPRVIPLPIQRLDLIVRLRLRHQIYEKSVWKITVGTSIVYTLCKRAIIVSLKEEWRAIMKGDFKSTTFVVGFLEKGNSDIGVQLTTNSDK